MEYIISILMIGFVFFCLKVFARFIDNKIAKKKKNAIINGEIEKKEPTHKILLETEHDIFVGGDRLDLEHIKIVLEEIGETDKYIVFVKGNDFSENAYAYAENGKIEFEK